MDEKQVSGLEWLDLAEEAGQLREAMAFRGPLERAKGILMALRRYSPDAAWAELRRVSSEENVKARELAVALVAFTSGQRAQTADGVTALVSVEAAAVVRRRWAAAFPEPGLRKVRPSASTLASTPGRQPAPASSQVGDAAEVATATGAP